jgi:S-adenosylmethionine decarboxylase
MEHEFKGKHLISDISGISKDIINDTDYIIKYLKEGILKSNSTIVGYSEKHFDENNGFTCVFLLAESHVSVHTYPENNSLFFDAFTCGDINPQIILNHFIKSLGKIKEKTQLIKRGN